MKREIKIGVRDLLNNFYHPKDLGGYFALGRYEEGSAGHQLIRAQRPREYKSEVSVDFTFDWEDYRLVVRGRIDGLLENGDALVVEEIKTTYLFLAEVDPANYPMYLAQLKLYLYFMMATHPDKQVQGRLTYLNLNDLSERSFDFKISVPEGAEFFRTIAVKYLTIERDNDNWRVIRNRSIRILEFPYKEKRPGQEDLMDTVTQALEQERDILVEAATGIGKTISVLYPSLKRLGVDDQNEGAYSQIFFLTAKTVGKKILEKTLQHMKEQGLRIRAVFIEAKERVCFLRAKCQPENCPYALGYYEKIETLIPALLKYEVIASETLLKAAKQAEVCPFELSLDIALAVDLIVCDYNYVFDPNVYLKRFFFQSKRKDFLFLIDEAHNLVTRGRDMYSATLAEQEIGAFKTKIGGQSRHLIKSLENLEGFFQNWHKEMDAEGRLGLKISRLPDMFEPALAQCVSILEKLLRESQPGGLQKDLQDFYYYLLTFTRIMALLNKDYVIYARKPAGEMAELRLLCLNPGPLLRKRLDSGRLAVFFSATLAPSSYFQELLGGREDALSISIPSPFPQENRLYMHIPGIDSRFRARGNSAQALAQCATDMVTAHTGNYLMFFPSYSYLNNIYPLVSQMLLNKAKVYKQFPNMNRQQKEEFLQRVTQTGESQSNLGLAVLGGLFGEGVDLPGEQLIGILIVTLGMPMVNDEQELIREYFEERNGQGYLYAYLIPGLIRVIQSAGRVFRTPEDRGVVMLVDERFNDERFRELLPQDWFARGREFSTPDYLQVLRDFWNE